MSETGGRQTISPAPDGALSIYVHIPFCARKCRYCAFYSVPYDRRQALDLTEAVLRELDLYAIRRPVQTLYIGGGSPSVLPTELLLPFLQRLTERTGPVQEWSVEVNPAQADAELFAALRRLGVNRLSIGAQSFHQDELTFLGRLHQPEDIARCIRQARQAGLDNIGLDLIYAIPGSSLKSWKQSLQKAINQEIVHLSAYALTYEKGTPLFADLQAGRTAAIDEDTDRAMYETAIDVLTAAGFEQYEISNFARPGFACRHNLCYWDNRPWLGLGPSAASYFQGRRTHNYSDLTAYTAAITEGRFAFEQVQTPSPLEIACETAVLNLRKTAGIRPDLFQKQTGFDPFALFAEPIRKYVSLGLIEAGPASIRLTRPALAIADSILCDFTGP